MASYSSQTVAQLKELLKAKGLSTAGVKSDLVARLEDSDSTTTATLEEPSEPQVAEPLPEESKPEAVLEPLPVESTTTTEPVTTQETEPKEPAKPELSPEEKKQAAVELLTSKIKRAQKFGDELSAKLYEQELKRIEKFGLNLSSDTAFELGFGVKDKNFIYKKHGGKGKKFRGGKFKGRRH